MLVNIVISNKVFLIKDAGAQTLLTGGTGRDAVFSPLFVGHTKSQIRLRPAGGQTLHNKSPVFVSTFLSNWIDIPSPKHQIYLGGRWRRS